MASEPSCSFSIDTRCTHSGMDSALARLLPASKMRILASGTPARQREREATEKAERKEHRAGATPHKAVQGEAGKRGQASQAKPAFARTT